MKTFYKKALKNRYAVTCPYCCSTYISELSHPISSIKNNITVYCYLCHDCGEKWLDKEFKL